jgi:hypothetical protein
MTTNFEIWRQSLNDKYGVSQNNQIINNNIHDLRNMKEEVHSKIKKIQEEREKNLNILKKEINIRTEQYKLELNDLKKEVEEKIKQLNENKNKNQNPIKNSYLRRNKRKYSELEN